MTLDTILNGDTLSYLRTVSAGSVDLVVSSPPYNLGKEYESRVCVRASHLSRRRWP
jgi:adenine-specific DNA-methyltransferase